MQDIGQALENIEALESSGTKSVPSQHTDKKLPSKSVRQKKKDSHKQHLNKKTFENKLKPRLDAKRYFPDDELAAVLEECRRTAMQQPAREVEIQVNTPSLTEMCQQTVDYLINVGKVQPSAEGAAHDAQNLEKVVKAQATAKVHVARRTNGKLVDVHEVEYVNRIEKRFTVVPKVLNVYLEQIGHFEIDGQPFIPKSLPPLRFNRLAAGRLMTGLERNSPAGVREIAIAIINPENIAGYVENGRFVGDPIDMVTQRHGVLEWIRADSIDDFQQLCSWYEGFITRCTRKAGSLLQNVVYAKGEGTAAQLVGSRDDPRILQREVWCCKKLDQNTLQIGGLFGYGYGSADKFHDEDLSCVTDRIDTEGMFQRIQRCQKL